MTTTNSTGRALYILVPLKNRPLLVVESKVSCLIFFPSRFPYPSRFLVTSFSHAFSLPLSAVPPFPFFSPPTISLLSSQVPLILPEPDLYGDDFEWKSRLYPRDDIYTTPKKERPVDFIPPDEDFDWKSNIYNNEDV